MAVTAGNGRFNVKVVLICVIVAAGLVVGAFASRTAWRRVRSRHALAAGQAAYESGEWADAAVHLREYLSRNQNDVEILRTYALARLRIRPYDPANMAAAIGAYRVLLQNAPSDREAESQLARYYAWIGDYPALAYIARKRLAGVPDDADAPMWLARSQWAMQAGREARATLEAYIDRCEVRGVCGLPYVEACSMVAAIAQQEAAATGDDPMAPWLERAVEHCPSEPRARVYRARMLRSAAHTSGQAAADLDAAEGMDLSNAHTRLLLCDEWIALGRHDRAAAHLALLDALDDDTIAAYFAHHDEWRVACFQRAAQIALAGGGAAGVVGRAEAVLATVTDRDLRLEALPMSIRLFAATGGREPARRYLTEYLELAKVVGASTALDDTAVLLRTAVLSAEDRPYASISLLEPLIDADQATPTRWKLLAQAYAETGQRRRAIAALRQYLLLRPADRAIQMQLARQYIAGDQWVHAHDAAWAPVLDADDVEVQLLRIECRVQVLARGLLDDDGPDLPALAAQLADLRSRYPDQTDVQLLQVSTAVAKADVAGAESLLSELADQGGELATEASIRRVRLLQNVGRTDEAIQIARVMCDGPDSEASAWIVLADLHLQAQQVDQALAVLAEAETRLTGEPRRRVAVKAAMTQLLHGSRAEAIDKLRGLASAEATDVDTRAVLLSLGEIQADPAVCQSLIDDIHQIEGDAGLAWRFQQARLWLGGDDWLQRREQIVQLLDRCIAGDPQWSRPVLLLGDFYERSGDQQQAETAYRHHLTSNPTSNAVGGKLLTMLRGQGRFVDAARVVDTLHEHRPEATVRPESSDVRILRERILWLASQGMYDELVEAVDPKAPGASDADIQYAAASILSTSPDRTHRVVALRLFEAVVAIRAEDVNAQHGLAIMAYQTGQGPRAIEALRAAAAIDGDHPEVLNDLAWILQESTDQLGEALTLIDAALEIAGDDPRLLDTRGAVLMRMGRMAEARLDLERSLQSRRPGAERARTLLKLAQVCLHLADTAEGKRHLQEAQQIDREHGVFDVSQRKQIDRLLRDRVVSGEER